ncbi:duf614 domain protein [Phlyctema vagabunda]|uniref:Duf614 domain protein n=1 Tax=Phlyctema vagabunda TaxID=108571 RepID=A0ABR4PKM4_9HELO
MKASPPSAIPDMARENSSTQSLERPVEPHDHMKRSGHDEWMVKFCVEPPDDWATCCQAFWCPCMLYSKTQYRLYQLAKGKDARILEKRKTCDGPCWTFCGLTVLSLCCILTSFQHTRVRSRYDIMGSLCGDYSMAFFCTTCALIQDDREVRAREGDLRLRTNPKKTYRATDDMIEAVPRQSYPMQYISPEPDASPSLTSNIVGSDNETPSVDGLLIHRLGQNVSNNNPIYFPSLTHNKGPHKDRSNSVPEKLRKQKAGKLKKRSPSLDNHHALSTVELDKPIRHHKIRRPAHGVSRKDTPAGVPRPSRGYHKGMRAYSSGVSSHDVGNQALRTRLHSFTLNSSSAHNQSDSEDQSDNPRKGPRTKKKPAGDRNAVEVEGGRVGGGFQQKIAARPFVSTSSVGKHQHVLSQDPVIRGRTVPELSYIHDFADCPIDGNVLDYIDAEERRYQQQNRTQRGRASSADGSISASHYRHTLADPCEAENDQQASTGGPARPTLRFKRMASYPTRSNKNSVREILPDRLVSCPSNCASGAQNRKPSGILKQQNQSEVPGSTPSRSIPAANTKTQGNGTDNDRGTRGRFKESQGSGRTRERALSRNRNTWSGKKLTKRQPGLRHYVSTGQLSSPIPSPTSTPVEAEVETENFIPLTQDSTRQYVSRDRKSAADHATRYGTVVRRSRGTEAEDAHVLDDCIPPMPVEGTAQHALAHCLAVDEGRKQIRTKGSCDSGKGGAMDAAHELRHTRSEEVLPVNSLPPSPEAERPRGKSQSEIEIEAHKKAKGKGSSWGWWEF